MICDQGQIWFLGVQTSSFYQHFYKICLKSFDTNIYISFIMVIINFIIVIFLTECKNLNSVKVGFQSWKKILIVEDCSVIYTYFTLFPSKKNLDMIVLIVIIQTILAKNFLYSRIISYNIWICHWVF